MAQELVDELIAVLAICGQDALLQVAPEALRPALQEGAYDAASFGPELAGRMVQVTLQATVPPPPFSDSPPERAQLHLMLPPGYPRGGAVAQALVTCGSRRRDWEARVSEMMQATADEAAGAGREVIYDLVQALQGELQAPEGAGAAGTAQASPPFPQQQQRRKVHARRSGRSGATAMEQQEQEQEGPPQQLHADAGGGCGGSRGSTGDQLCAALLRLDHMRDRPSYCKLVSSWASELALTGRLLFLGPIILVVLEGKAQDIKECLMRWRTRPVDVDSRGQACRERMLTVVCEGQARAARGFKDFREQEVGSREELTRELSRAALQDWAVAATGLG